MNFANEAESPNPSMADLACMAIADKVRSKWPQLSVSVVTNTIDRAESLRNLLRALEQQSYPNFEVVVVVGPTHDHTLEVLETYGGRVRVLRCPRANLSQSRNIGLHAAKGDIVAYIDDDAVPSRRWLEQLVRLFADPNIDATGGKVYLVNPDMPYVQHQVGIVSALSEQVDVCETRLEHIVPPGMSTFWTGRMMGTNMAYRRQALLDAGGFDEFYEWVYDDTDIAIRLTQAGKHVYPVLEAPVYHVPASSRNRQTKESTGRWWIGTKAGIYFGIKNGRWAGDGNRSTAIRGLHLIHGHWLANSHRWREGKISMGQLLYATAQEFIHAGKGVSAGLQAATVASRRAAGPISKRAASPERPPIESPQLENAMTESSLPASKTTGDTSTSAAPVDASTSESSSANPITPFQDSQSALQPTTDPVTGRQPKIQLTEPPLRICLLSNSYPPDQIEGIGRLTNLMAKGLFELGHTVHVIAAGEKEETTFYDGAYVHRIPRPTNRYSAYRRLPNLYHSLNYSHAVYDKVKKLMLNDGIQVVDSPIWQIEGLTVLTSQLLPVVIRPTTALRQVAALHKDFSDDSRLVGEMEEMLLRKGSFIASNSHATVKAIQEVYGVNPDSDKLVVFPYGIEPVADEEIIPFDPENPPETFTILYLGRLEKRKGIMELFEAIPTVLESFPNARFILAGKDNSAADGFQGKNGQSYTDYFKARNQQHMDRVDFLGHVTEEELKRLYQTCDLFVAPSHYESFGLIYIEAMNYAKPVIGCHAGGIPEVVDDGVTGVLVDPASAPQLAAAILDLLRSPQKLYEMGNAGRQQVLEKFTYVTMAKGFEAVYRKVLAKRE